MPRLNPNDGRFLILAFSALVASVLAYVTLGIRNIRTNQEGFYFCSGILKLKYVKYEQVRSVNIVSFKRDGLTFHKTFVTLDTGKVMNIGDMNQYSSLTFQLKSRCEMIGEGPVVKSLIIDGSDFGFNQKYPNGYICDWSKADLKK